jgi:sugar phosphate isomerase/epimerase
MIFISSACVKNKKIKDSVKELADNGFTNIELSGGTEYYEGFEDDLLVLKKSYSLNYRCHNYFPPPKNHLVLNLASLNHQTFDASFNHLKEAISLSERLEAKFFGFHAGFFIDIRLSEIGKKLTKVNLFNKDESISKFCDAFELLQKIDKNINLYIENNVFSKSNSDAYHGENPFMMTHFKAYKSLKEKIDFNLLLDVAHLKVSVKTLGLNWKEEFNNMMNHSTYIHISDNDSLHDLNNRLTKKSSLFSMLKGCETKNKDFTLEIYDGIPSILESYEALEEAIE